MISARERPIALRPPVIARLAVRPDQRGGPPMRISGRKISRTDRNELPLLLCLAVISTCWDFSWVVSALLSRAVGIWVVNLVPSLSSPVISPLSVISTVWTWPASTFPAKSL
ncbi:hypothetical protein HS99_0002275 [Kitasatospora aureofaciens]|uniref:Uncharacterized protein n=1 Tax=Kitasatospora aureofaciens TaxID=1894 RepID=A0A1E7NFT1_KITAU|nr:hypothetical protein HS99_0002275 [Kitasatospora aureofaciens]